MSHTQLTKIPETLQRTLQEELQKHALIQTIVQKIVSAGGRVLLVGGAVRDLFLQLPIKDLDFEVHGLSLEQLEQLLATVGPVNLVGKSFGVLRVAKLDVDFAVPRRDSAGRKPRVVVDEVLSIQDAFRRRDLTINAMGIDVTTFELIDPFDGLSDLQNKILRATDAHLFTEDPLRFYRVMQFIGRFGMNPDSELNRICAHMDIAGVSRERIEVEFQKLFLRSAEPSRGIRWLYAIGRLADVLPELAETVGVPQRPDYHPEGDVFEHTMQSLDAAVQLEYENQEQKLIVMYAVLCHDLGKVATTELIDGVWRSRGHAQEGAPLAVAMLKRITHTHELIVSVEKLVIYHMEPVNFIKGNANAAAYRRLAKKLAPQVTIELLAKVAQADKRGRNAHSSKPLAKDAPEIVQFIQKARSLGVEKAPIEPLLQGKDLLEHVQAGPILGAIIKRVYEIQIDEGLTDKQELKRRALQIYEELNKKNKA